MVKLLFVEDEPDFEEVVRSLLSEEIESGEYEIIYAHDGQEALEKIEADRGHQIDLLLTDLKMPLDKMDGFTLIQTLRQKNIYINIIVISAFATVDNYRRALRENVLFFLEKPLKEQELKSSIENSFKKSPRFDKDSRKVRFNTLAKAALDLPSKQKAKLITKLADNLELSEIDQLQTELFERLKIRGEEARKRQKEKELLKEKVKRGEITIDIPIDVLEGLYIEERPIKQRNGNVHVYYYLKWREDGKMRSRYLGTKDPRKK